MPSIKASSPQGNVGFVKNSTLIFIAFVIAFYARIFCSVTRAPSILNFLHYPVVLAIAAIALSTTRIKDRRQVTSIWMLIVALGIFLFVTIVSAIINNAGVSNIIVNFLILGEPFIFIIAIACIDFPGDRLDRFRRLVIISGIVNLLLAIVQRFLLLASLISAHPYDETDGVQGVFFVSGAGGYISAAVSVAIFLYCFLYQKQIALWIRLLGLAGTLYQIQIADTKQVVLVCGLAWLALVFGNIKDPKKMALYGSGIVIAFAVFWWLIHNVEMFAVYAQWFSRDDINNTNSGGGWDVKTEGIRRVLAHYRSSLNWLFGLGPGHTLGRLGGWTITDMWEILSKFGATKHPLYNEMWTFIYGNWIAYSTTLYVPLFTWAGIWGDLGWVGVATYLYLGFLVWHYFCVDDYCRFLMLTIFIYGFFLTQVEEPGFMLTMSMLLGLRWHETRTRQARPKIAANYPNFGK